MLPDSAFGRSALLIGGALLIGQILMSLLMRQLIVGPAAEQLATMLAEQSALVATLVDATPRGQRDALLERLATGSELHLDRSPAGPAGGAPLLFYQRTIARALAERLGPGAQVRVQWGDETRIWVHPRPDAPFWLGMTARRLEQGVPGVLALWVLVLVGIAAGGGLVLAHFLNRDLRRLADRAGRMGRGEDPGAPHPGGPRELRALGLALELMARDLRQSAQDRAVLLAGVSHDLRTPLARIRLSLEMLGDADPELRDGIALDVDEMDAIIGQFIASIRDGHDEAPVPVDLNALIREVAARVARVRPPPALHLGELPLLALRPMAVRRLLINLLENAHRHGGEPVEVVSGTAPGRLVVRVLDRGPGVAEEEIEALFEPFTRGRTRGGGSGLGLVIARRIARLHGGELSLANRAGGGLEARVEWPLGG